MLAQQIYGKNLEKSLLYESQIAVHYMHATLNCFYRLVASYFPFILNINKFSNLRNGNKVISVKPMCTFTSITTEYSDCRLS